LIKPGHTVAATKIIEAIGREIERVGKYTISVGGESGSGKSEIASELRRLLEQREIPTGILQMDDYFIFPSRMCHEMRTRNVEQVGMYEARLDFLECNLRSFKRGEPDIYKPLSIYQENRFTTEVMEVGQLRVLIAEGTYTTTLRFVDCHVFLDRDYHDSKADREKRARDVLDELMADILEREHRIISQHKQRADIIVNKDFSEIEVTRSNPSPWA
jgi:uridine kinase